MYALLTKLLLSRKLNFEEGKITLFDKPYAIIGMESLKEMTDDDETSDETSEPPKKGDPEVDEEESGTDLEWMKRLYPKIQEIKDEEEARLMVDNM